MPELKVGVQWTSLRQPLRRGLQLAAEMGADAVELEARGELDPRELTQTAIRQIRRWVDDYNLRVCAVGFRTRYGYDQPDELDRRIAATKAAMKMAFALGASVVVNQVGRVPEDSSDPRWAILQEALLDLGTYSQHAGAWLAAETGSESGPDLARLVGSLPEGYLSVALNPGNLIVNGFSASEAVGELGQHVVYVYAKDGTRDLARGRGLEVPLGRGSADFPQLIGRLEEFGYRGFFTVARDSGQDPIGELRAAVQYLRSL